MKVSVNDFSDVRFADIQDPERGLFGYLLRCRSLPEEDVTGNVIFLDNGDLCFERLPKEIEGRVLRRKPWTNSRWLYKNEFVGQLMYVDEDKLPEFVDLMETAPDSEVQAFLTELLEKAKSHPVAQHLLAYKLEPLFAVTHIRQLEDEVHMSIPHIHILWGKRKKKRNRK